MKTTLYPTPTLTWYRFVRLLACIYAVGLCSSSMAQEMTDEQKTLYALGLNMGQSIRSFALTPAELEVVKKGMSDAIFSNKPMVSAELYDAKIQAFAQSRQAQAASKQALAGKAFLDRAAQEKNALKTPSGMVYITLKEGTGPSPLASDTVRVHYRGTSIEGAEFDSSYKRGQPAEFALNSVIRCWTEGVQKMKVGGKARLVCPAALAYGDRGAPPSILGGATLNFEVELLGISKAK